MRAALLFPLFAAASASELVVSPLSVSSTFGLKSPDVKLCSPCFDITKEGLNYLMNYILNAGVVGGCEALCAGALPAGGLPAAGCDLVCAAVGIKAFIAAIKRVDLDPIYMCEAVGACPTAPDNASAAVVDIACAPNPVRKGQTIKMAVQVNVTTATGVGEFRIHVDGPGSATPIDGSFFLETGIPAGEQLLEVSLPVKDEDPNKGSAKFKPGLYTYSFHVCQGECGSKHPHSKDFGQLNGTFTLTDDAPVTTSPGPSGATTTAPSCLEVKRPGDCVAAKCHWCERWGGCREAWMPNCDFAV